MKTAYIYKKYIHELSLFSRVSREVGIPAHVQGGGGNTSVKLPNGLMAIKASGYRLDEVMPDKGFALVEYAPIAAYFNLLPMDKPPEDLDERYNELIAKYTIKPEDAEPLRPSVEACVHALLDQYVVHTHSVYANLACCARNMNEILAAALPGVQYSVIDYVDPGATLAWAVHKEIHRYPNSRYVIFVQNHGLFVSGQTAAQAHTLHVDICQALAKWFFAEPYPVVKLELCADGSYLSATDGLRDKLAGLDRRLLCEDFLYPDHQVFMADADEETLRGHYRTKERSARTLEELLTALVYMYETALKTGITLVPMNEAAKGFIGSWESEKYRRSIDNK